jgi:lytic murein transglycosylase
MIRCLPIALAACLAVPPAAVQAEATPPTQETGAMPVTEAVSLPVPTEAEFRVWISGFRDRAKAAGIAEGVIDRTLAEAQLLPDVVERDRRQAEFTKAIWDYLDIAVSDERVAGGRAALARHEKLLDRIEAEFGVDREVVLAIWGVETSFGSFIGSTNTISALATLSADTRRRSFFEDQLLAALKIVQSGDADPARMTGSWAGAMGHPQFMPTSFLDHAVDFDGDGRRDIWSVDPADGLASAAAYLKHHGWQKGQPWGVEIRVPEGFDFTLTGVGVKKPPAFWAALGIRDTDGRVIPDHGPASILFPAGHRGAAFMIFPNFHVVEAYNPADAYVIGVGHLADRIGGGGALVHGWPRDLRVLTPEERIELQSRLVARGYDTGGVDGRIGPKTVAAIMAFQQTLDLVPDGFASPDLLMRLR